MYTQLKKPIQEFWVYPDDAQQERTQKSKKRIQQKNSIYTHLKVPHARASVYTQLKEPLNTWRLVIELCRLTEKPYKLRKETHNLTKQPYMLLKEPCRLTEKPCKMRKETHELTKEP